MRQARFWQSVLFLILIWNCGNRSIKNCKYFNDGIEALNKYYETENTQYLNQSEKYFLKSLDCNSFKNESYLYLFNISREKGDFNSADYYCSILINIYDSLPSIYIMKCIVLKDRNIHYNENLLIGKKLLLSYLDNPNLDNQIKNKEIYNFYLILVELNEIDFASSLTELINTRHPKLEIDTSLYLNPFPDGDWMQLMPDSLKERFSL